ncbi:hypothetical protein [Spongiivirga citrea]|uniref:Uncharacterized protein n=1 Tax=Spongiivirga citrea TaxID=1481457 RepID=A0A6M0CQ50_9FLAO|nr:hypothetical protein [Spongiivirga citrea]NER19043.1 hypothetical protein [Spongiivirga citrea]
MLLNTPQRTAVKQLFFVLLALALFDILVDVILRVVFDFSYESLVIRLSNWLKFNIAPFVLWYFIRLNVSNKKAADFAIITLGVIALVRLSDVFFGILVGQFTPYPILNTVIYSLPFLVFGFAYHKNTKGLWYFLVFLIISGVAVGSAYQINNFISELFRYRPWRWLGNLLSYNEGMVFIAPLPMLYYKLIFIVHFVIFFYMHYAIKSSDNNAFQFKKLDVQPVSNLVFSVVFWVSRLTIIVMIFGLVNRIRSRWGINEGSYIQAYVWILSVIAAAYFFTLIYRNFLTSYFVSKGIKPGWKYILINLPVINFFVWLYITFFVNVPSNISLSDRVDKVTALFKNSDRNNNIKVAFYVVTLLGAVIRLISSRGRIDPIIISLISAALGIAILTLYFKHARTALFLFGLNALVVLAAPFGEISEATPLFIYSMIYTLLWISIFHFDKYEYVNDLSLSTDGLGQLTFIKKDVKPFEPKDLSGSKKTYWKTIFIALLAAIVIKIIILISQTNFGFSYFRDGPVLRLLGSIFILTIFAIYANNINTALKKKAPLSKTTKVLEIVCYGIGVWYLFAIIAGFISLIVMAFNDYYSGPSALIIITGLFLNIVLVVSLVLIFIARYRYIGSYATSFNQMEFVAKNLSVEKLKSQQFSTLEDRLVLCKTCENRKLTTDGLVCSLTSERPTFEAYCVDYNADEKQLKRQNELKSEANKGGFFGSWKGALVMSLLGFIRAGLAGFSDPFGLIFLILGVAWLVAALVSKKD